MLGSAEGIGRGSSIAVTLNEAWHSPSLWPAMFLTIWVACSSSCSVSSESLLLLFSWPWIPRSTDWASKMGKGVGPFVWCSYLVKSSPWRLTPSSRLCRLPAGWPQSQQVILVERSHNGHKIIWVPAVPVLGVLACKPRNKQRMPFKWDLCVPGTCVYNMNRHRTGEHAFVKA